MTPRPSRTSDPGTQPAASGSTDSDRPAGPPQPGEPRAPLSLREIAARAGVSAQTLRRFLKEPARLSAHMHQRLQPVLADLLLIAPPVAPPPQPPQSAPTAQGDEGKGDTLPPRLDTGHATADTGKPQTAHEQTAHEPAPPCPEEGVDRLTITEVAALAGVSTKTISRYLNQSPLLSDAMRQRVEEVVQRTGFVPNAQARALALRRNFLVALAHAGADPGILEAVEGGMLEAMAGTELALLHCPLPAPAANAATLLQTFLARHAPCGLVLLPPLSQSEDVARTCRRAGVSCIRLGATRDGSGLDGDDRRAMAELVTWLVEQGHQRIALVSGPEDSLSARERELGYLDAMADHGLDRGPALIEPGDNGFASGIAAGRVLLELSPRPSAIIACSDAMAAGLLHAAGEARIAVPDELSLVGFDDTALAGMTWPALTTMHVPWRELGGEAVRRLQAPLTADPADPPHSPTRSFRARRVDRGTVQPLTRPVPARSALSLQARSQEISQDRSPASAPD